MLQHTVKGKGNRVVLLHGFLETQSMWDPLELENYFQILQIDLPGHGQTGDTKTVSTIRAMAVQVKQVVDFIDWHSFSIIGHSMGGYVALELAQLIPIQKVVLLHSNFWADSTDKRLERERVAKIALMNGSLFIQEAFPNLFIRPSEHNLFIADAIEQAKQMSNTAISQSTLAMKDRCDFSLWVKENKEKVILIQGEKDPIIPLSTSIEKAANTCAYFVIEDCGHMGHVEQTENVLAVLLTSLQKV